MREFYYAGPGWTEEWPVTSSGESGEGGAPFSTQSALLGHVVKKAARCIIQKHTTGRKSFYQKQSFLHVNKESYLSLHVLNLSLLFLAGVAVSQSGAQGSHPGGSMDPKQCNHFSPVSNSHWGNLTQINKPPHSLLFLIATPFLCSLLSNTSSFPSLVMASDRHWRSLRCFPPGGPLEGGVDGLGQGQRVMRGIVVVA